MHWLYTTYFFYTYVSTSNKKKEKKKKHNPTKKTPKLCQLILWNRETAVSSSELLLPVTHSGQCNNFIHQYSEGSHVSVTVIDVVNGNELWNRINGE